MACRRGGSGSSFQRADAVKAVREVLERRMSGGACFRDELETVEPDLKVLEARELKVKNLGGVYGRVEMSSYVRDMLKEAVSGQPA